jgi:hypothetical protein
VLGQLLQRPPAGLGDLAFQRTARSYLRCAVGAISVAAMSQRTAITYASGYHAGRYYATRPTGRPGRRMR